MAHQTRGRTDKPSEGPCADAASASLACVEVRDRSECAQLFAVYRECKKKALAEVVAARIAARRFQ